MQVDTTHALSQTAEDRQPSKMASARVLSYNFNVLPRGSGGYQNERIETFLSSVGAYDVILLQEVYSTSYLPYALQKRFCYQKLLLDGLKSRGFHHYVISRQPSYSTVLKYGVLSDNGLIIASRFPIGHRGSYTFRTATGGERTVSKGCLFAEVEVPCNEGEGSERVVFFNVHMRPEDKLPSESSQVQEVLRFVEAALDQVESSSSFEEGANVRKGGGARPSFVIAGDFNVNGIDHATGLPSKKFSDLLSQFGSLEPMRDVVFEESGTNPPTRPPKLFFPELSKLEHYDAVPQRQDYFLVCPSVSARLCRLEKFVVGSRRPYTYLSDHFGIFCVLGVAVEDGSSPVLGSPSRLNVSSLVEAANHERSNPTSNTRLEAVLLLFLAWWAMTVSLKPLIMVAMIILVARAYPTYATSGLLSEAPSLMLAAMKGRSSAYMQSKVFNPLADVQTVASMWERSVMRFRTSRCLGAAGDMGGAEWLSYGAVDVRARELGAGLLQLGVAPGDLVGIECDACRSAAVVEIACALYGFVTVPLAGKRSTIRGLLDQKKIRLAFADRSAVVTFLTCRSTSLETVIYMHPFADEDDQATAKDLSISLVPFDYVEQKGRLNPVAPNTGVLRGDSILTYALDNTNNVDSVEETPLIPVTHADFMRDLGVMLVTGVLPSSYKRESMVWFTPFALLFNRLCVLGMLSQGNAVAASDANHLQESFARFRPTVLVTSPALFSTSRLQLSRSQMRYSGVYNWLFNTAYQLRSRLIHVRHRDSSLLGFLFFRAFYSQLGGNVRRIVLSVSHESTSFALLEHISVCYVPCVCEVSHISSVGVCTIDGTPVPGIDISLSPMDELSSKAKIGQLTIAEGDEAGAKVDIAARWIKGESALTFLGSPLGILWPCDYQYSIAAELERTFSKSRYVENIFLYCDPLRPVIAVVYPNRDTVEFEWRLAKSSSESPRKPTWRDLVDYAADLIMDDLKMIATEENLHASQMPRYIHLHPHAFSDHTSFLTPFGKVRRQNVRNYFAAVFEKLYNDTVYSPNTFAEEAMFGEASDTESCTTSLIGSSSSLRLQVPFTIDIGGTFAKVAFILPPDVKNFSLFPFIVNEASSLSDKLGLRTFRFFADEEKAEDELQLHPHSRVGTLRFAKIPSQKIPQFAEYLGSVNAMASFKSKYAAKVRSTGGGSFKYAALARSVVGVEFEVVKEMDAVVKGLNLVLRVAPESVFTVEPTSGEHLPHKLVSPGDTFSPFPYLLINIGSGISFIKCTGADGSHVRVGGSPIGGATFWGLVRTMTNLTSWEEVMEIMRLDGPGDNKNVDLLVGDIYGYNAKDLPAMLSSETVASTFGKFGTERFYDGRRESTTDHFADDGATGEILSPTMAWRGSPNTPFQSDYDTLPKATSSIDIVRSLLNMIASNVTQLAYLHARLHNVKNVFFAGGFVRDNPMVWSLISFSMHYWSNGEVAAHFLQHDGYLGALGCAILDPSDDEEE